ncbi:hypothetical protein D3C80_2067550 [compost metagenome]
MCLRLLRGLLHGHTGRLHRLAHGGASDAGSATHEPTQHAAHGRSLADAFQRFAPLRQVAKHLFLGGLAELFDGLDAAAGECTTHQ